MTYAIQQFHATRYVTVATADTLKAAFTAAGAVKRKAPELPVRIVEKPEAESVVLKQIKTTKERITAWPDG